MSKWIASEHQGFFKRSTLGKYDREAVGLSFSGGGYRATLFHTGVVLRLNDLGALGRVDRISSVSGGSITSGLLAKAWPHLGIASKTDKANPAAMKEHFINPILEATSRTLDVRVGFAGFLPFVSAGNRLAQLYDRYIFDDLKLRDIPAHPKFVFNATNLQTQGLVRFTRNYIADWRAFFSTTNDVNVSQAVAASSAFPPVLAPLRLDLRDETVITPEGARFDDKELRDEPILIDGGVYDNLGMESIWKRCGVLIGSYSGQNNAADPSNFSFDHLLPMVNTFLASSIDWRERMLVSMFQNMMEDGLPERAGTYWTAETDITAFPVHDGWKPSKDEFDKAKNTPTRLEALDADEQRVIINAGYAYADAGLRSYLMPDAPAPSGPPDID